MAKRWHIEHTDGRPWDSTELFERIYDAVYGENSINMALYLRDGAICALNMRGEYVPINDYDMVVVQDD